MKIFVFLLLFSLSLPACDMLQKKESSETKKKKKALEESEEDNSEEKKPKKKKSVIEDEIETNSKGEILNNIIVHESGGLKAGRVYLAFEDGRLVPKTNRVTLGTPVYLVFAIEDGWTVEDGMVSLDAEEKIVTNNGELVLNAPNLFKTTPLVKKSDAAYINLKAGIARTRDDIEYYVVNYRLWDKKGEGEIKGSYKLYIDNTTE